MADGSLVVLLRVRDGAAAVPGFLAATGFADGIVALDEGSTDGTRELLAAHPLVRRLLSTSDNVMSADAAAGYNRLLAAAAELEATWLLVLEVEERLAAEDAAALRAFIAGDALPGCAYGFRRYRMSGDLAHYDGTGPWLYRLFAAAPEQQFADPLPQFARIPRSISPALWLRTTLRIQDISRLHAAQRQALRAQAAQGEDGRGRAGYGALLERAGPRRRWVERPPDLPVLVGAGVPSWAVGELAEPETMTPGGEERAHARRGVPALQLWSGGKDSAFALWVSRQRGVLDIQALLSIIVEGSERTNWHGVRTALMHQQAAAIGLPLLELRVPSLEQDARIEALTSFLSSPQAARYTTVVWGDLHEADVHRGVEACHKAGKDVARPLSDADRVALARTIMAAGFEAVVTAVAPWGGGLDARLAGREFDEAFLAALPKWVDPCGEEGEFHTFVYDGPIFHQPIAFRRVGLFHDGGYVTCDLEPLG